MAKDDEFTAFAQSATGSLLRLGWLLTADGHQAQDLVQSALVRTYVAWNRITGDDPLAYTRKIMVNVHNDWLRRRPWRERSRDQVPERPVTRDAHSSVEDRAALVQALQSLSRRERTTVVLRYYIDLSETETAQTMGVSVGTVKSVSCRALRKLRIDPALDSSAHPREQHRAGIAAPAYPLQHRS
jgi:RNA polymerase sigma-70 factor (sigma-E family)